MVTNAVLSLPERDKNYRNDVPIPIKFAFSGDNRRKSLRRRKYRTRNAEATKEASYGKFTNEGQYVANALDTFPTAPIIGGHLDLPRLA